MLSGCDGVSVRDRATPRKLSEVEIDQAIYLVDDEAGS